MAGVFDIDLETEDISDTEVGCPQSFVRSQLTNELLKQVLVWTHRDCTVRLCVWLKMYLKVFSVLMNYMKHIFMYFKTLFPVVPHRQEDDCDFTVTEQEK